MNKNRTRLLSFSLIAIVLLSCERKGERTTSEEFESLMHKLAEAWTNQDVDPALECFTADAVYIQPPAEQFYKGHEQLRPFFEAIKDGTLMKFHNIWFDKEKQMGAGEFTFGNSKSMKGVTGVIIVTIENGKIKTWREYFISGPIDFDEFISIKNKEWKWTIENYP